MRTDEFDYELPPERIAQTPVEPRDAARLLVYDRAADIITHRFFRDLGDYLREGDVLVFNQTRVIPARLHGHKEESGGKVEVLLLRREDAQVWRALVGGRRVREGTRLLLGNSGGPPIRATVTAAGPRSERELTFDEPLGPHLDRVGEVPLPPYIHTPLADAERYQTVYAREPGSAAAPTAGLHFTPQLLALLERKGVRLAYCTLHIGLDTFQPVQAEHIEEHAIHTERAHLSPADAQRIDAARAAGGRVVAVGTTTVRVLETAASGAIDHSGHPRSRVAAFDGDTSLYITPGYRFRAVDALVTNFHLPRSTLLMLVSAFAGQAQVRHAYASAIEHDYRFYSFGDACLFL